MKIRLLVQLLNYRDLRNALVGAVVVIGGTGLAALMVIAHRNGDSRLAGISAAVSLVFVLLILIFVVPPLARNAGREASQMNLPFDFTIGGALVLGLMVIVAFSAWNTGNNLLFLILSFLAASMIVGFFAGSMCLQKLDIKMRFSETIFAGEPTSILVSLHNRKWLFPTYSIVAEVRGKERSSSIAGRELASLLPRVLANRLAEPPLVRKTLNYFVHVARKSSVEEKAHHVFRHRGRFLIQDFELSTKFPFGFFRHRRRLSAKETELIVFPHLDVVEPEFDQPALDVGKLETFRRGLGQDLLALRDYEPNDDLRRIDWKATARTRQLTVREFAAEDERRVTVIVDSHLIDEQQAALSLREKIEAEQSDRGGPVSERFERGISLAASVVAHFTELQAEIRLVIDNDAGEFGIGARHLHECLRRLAIVEPSGEPRLDVPILVQMLDERTGSQNFIVTASAEAGLSTIAQNLTIIGF